MTKADIVSEVLRKHPENNLQARILSINQVLICMDQWEKEVIGKRTEAQEECNCTLYCNLQKFGYTDVNGKNKKCVLHSG